MSQQNAQTPRAFIEAVEKKFGVKFVFDLACTTLDAVSPNGYYFDKGINALDQDWSKIEWRQNEAAWLNPPWKHIKPWAKKCSEGTDHEMESEDTTIWMPGVPIFSLFPAGVGSDWFADYVLGQAAVYCLSPRITYLDPRTGLPFVSKKTGKPQTGLNDCILVDWECTLNDVGVYAWKWCEKKSRKGIKRGPRKPKVVVPDNLDLSPPADCPDPEHGTVVERDELGRAVNVELSRDDIIAKLQQLAKRVNVATVPELVRRAQAGEWPGSILETEVSSAVHLLGNDDPILEGDE